MALKVALGAFIEIFKYHCYNFARYQHSMAIPGNSIWWNPRYAKQTKTVTQGLGCKAPSICNVEFKVHLHLALCLTTNCITVKPLYPTVEKLFPLLACVQMERQSRKSCYVAH